MFRESNYRHYLSRYMAVTPSSRPQCFSIATLDPLTFCFFIFYSFYIPTTVPSPSPPPTPPYRFPLSSHWYSKLTIKVSLLVFLSSALLPLSHLFQPTDLSSPPTKTLWLYLVHLTSGLVPRLAIPVDYDLICSLLICAQHNYTIWLLWYLWTLVVKLIFSSHGAM